MFVFRSASLVVDEPSDHLCSSEDFKIQSLAFQIAKRKQYSSQKS